MFPFMKDKDVSEHYKMIEQVLEDEKMVNLINVFLWLCLDVWQSDSVLS